MKRLKCPVCDHIAEVKLSEGQTTHRCGKCTRRVRVEAAPRKRRTKAEIEADNAKKAAKGGRKSSEGKASRRRKKKKKADQ